MILSGAASSRLRVALTIALGYNCGFGLIYGSYGVILRHFESDFHITRVESSLGITGFILGLCLTSPFGGIVITRFNPRLVLSISAATSGLTYTLMSIAGSFYQIVALYFLLGCMASIFAIVAPVSIISQWFTTNRTKVLSATSLPIFQLLLPPLATAVLARWNMATLSLGMAAVLGLLALLYGTLPRSGHQPKEAASSTSNARNEAAETGLAGEITRDRRFWMVSLGVGLIAGGGVMFSSHAIAFSLESAMTAGQAATLLSIFGAAGVPGILFFGWLADRTRPTIAFALSAFVQVVAWTALIYTKELIIMMICSGFIGAALMALPPLHGSALAELFGRARVGRAMGFSYLVKLPFMLGAAPLAGYLHDRDGSYDTAFLLQAGLVLTAGAVMCALALEQSKGRPSAVRSGTAELRPTDR